MLEQPEWIEKRYQIYALIDPQDRASLGISPTIEKSMLYSSQGSFDRIAHFARI